MATNHRIPWYIDMWKTLLIAVVLFTSAYTTIHAQSNCKPFFEISCAGASANGVNSVYLQGDGNEINDPSITCSSVSIHDKKNAFSVTLSPGETYEIDVTVQYFSGYRAAAFIYANNGWQLVGSSNSPSAFGGVIPTFDIDIPAGLAGSGVLRVLAVSGGLFGGPIVWEACGNYGAGSGVDYTVNVAAYDCPTLGTNIGDACDDDGNGNEGMTNIYCECVPAIPYGCENPFRFPSQTILASSEIKQISSCSFNSDYTEIGGVVTGQSYKFTSFDNSSGVHGYITLRSGTPGGYVVAAGFSPLTLTATSDDNLFVHFNSNASCGTNSNCLVTTVQCTTCGIQVPGCTDPTSCNYNPAATIDDGSCEVGFWYIPTVNGSAGSPAILACDDDVAPDGYILAESQDCVISVIANDSWCFTNSFDFYCTSAYNECLYDCPLLTGNIGDSCDDGDAATHNDLINDNCQCVGTPVGTTLNGTVVWNSNCGERDATVKLYVPNTATLVASYDVSIQADGSFSIPGVETGTFDVIVNVDKYLAKGIKNVVITAGANNLAVGAIIPGDLNNDGFVNFTDFTILATALSSDTFNPVGDLNCDGFVNFTDFTILSNSMGEEGDTAPLQ